MSGTPFNNSLGDLASQLNFVRIKPFAVPALFKSVFIDRYSSFQGYQSRAQEQRRRKLARQGETVDVGAFPQIATFVCLMRKFLMRHTKDQHKIGTTKSLVSLPPKTQRTIYVEFSAEEHEIYKALQQKAKRGYLRIRGGARGGVMRNTLYRLAKMQALRDVCSGGKLPDPSVEDDDDGDDAAPRKANPPYQMKVSKRRRGGDVGCWMVQ